MDGAPVPLGVMLVKKHKKSTASETMHAEMLLS